MFAKTSATRSLLALLVIAPAFAEGPLTASIPFDFKVGKMLMSAGDYTLNFDVPGRVQLVRDDHKASWFVTTIGEQTKVTSDIGKLVFNKYGDSYFLSQIWMPGYEAGRQLRQTKAELEIARNVTNVQRASVPASQKGPFEHSPVIGSIWGV